MTRKEQNVKKKTDVISSCPPGGSAAKNLPANAGEAGSIPGSGRSPGEGNGNPLQDSCLENPMDRGAWHAIVYGTEKSQTWLKQQYHPDNSEQSLHLKSVASISFKFPLPYNATDVHVPEIRIWIWIWLRGQHFSDYQRNIKVTLNKEKYTIFLTELILLVNLCKYKAISIQLSVHIETP